MLLVSCRNENGGEDEAGGVYGLFALRMSRLDHKKVVWGDGESSG